MRREDQDRAITEVTGRVIAELVARSEKGPPLDEVLAESIYHERRRLKDEHDPKIKKHDTEFWNAIQSRLPRSNERVHKEALTEVVTHYAREISGNFDERVYQAVTRAGPAALGLLLNAVSPKRLLTANLKMPSMDEALVIQGETEQLRRLHEIGTVILVPTHVSNLDSIIVGYALYRLGLPPFIYGAGLNLFSNPLIGYFMHNLGAYTVDRKKQDPLYKEVLKTYATVTLELGYDNIFFPGGTRSRSGALERRLKLGLLGTGISAYVHNLKRSAPQPRIFVVPATLSIQLVLEAETLVDDFLKEVGKSRYIITDDEFSQPRRIFDFLTQLLNLDSKIYFTIGKGMDPFGNPVDENGESHDPMGRRIDTTRYVLAGGEPVEMPSRDAEYTREVGERAAEAYFQDSVVQATNLTAMAAFDLLRKHNPKVDLLRLIRSGGETEEFPLREMLEETTRLLAGVRSLARQGKIRLDPVIADRSAEDVVADGLRHFAIYHRTPALTRRGDRIFPTDRDLLFYYQNRLEGYGLNREIGLPPALSPDHRALGGKS